jgi:hypothetical protein
MSCTLCSAGEEVEDDDEEEDDDDEEGQGGSQPGSPSKAKAKSPTHEKSVKKEKSKKKKKAPKVAKELSDITWMPGESLRHQLSNSFTYSRAAPRTWLTSALCSSVTCRGEVQGLGPRLLAGRMHFVRT